MPKYLYLPIEIGSRELNAKLLTAASAVERGFTVLFGFQYHLFRNHAKLPPGIFFSKGSNKLYLSFVPHMRAAGHAFVASEEENFGYCLNEAPVAFNPAELPANCDLYLCMGACEARYVEGRFGPSFPKVITGNARMDMLRSRMRALSAPAAAEIRKQYGKFVLLNMNFGLTNPNMETSLQGLFNLWVSGGIFVTTDPKVMKQQFMEFVQWERDNSREMQKLIALLATRKIPVVIRPHPSESSESWRAIVGQYDAPHIHVLHGAPLVPYMLACEMMIHPGCTTGMEAAVLGVPAVSVNAGATNVPNYYVSPKVNPGAATAEEALSLIEQHWAGSDVLTRERALHLERLSDYVADLTEDVLTADRIVDALDQFVGERAFPEDGRTVNTIPWATTFEDAESFETNHRYRLAKFAITPADVERTLADFRSALGRFGGVEAKEVYEGIYLIRKAA
jgi:surface carbohydrate biosynthesis protein